MNVERLTKLAEWLEAGAPHETITFDMARGLCFRETIEGDAMAQASCQSVCCLAGAAVQFFNYTPALIAEHGVSYAPSHVTETFGITCAVAWHVVRDEARYLLDLTENQANSLFTPPLYFQSLRYPAKRVAHCVRNLIATGRVDWYV